jgi:hypothetical protein
MLVADRDFTIEQLVERSLRSPTTAVATEVCQNFKGREAWDFFTIPKISMIILPWFSAG